MSAVAVSAPAAAGKLKVFISYSRRDALDFAQQLKSALEAFGHEVLLDTHGIAGGERWEERLLALILEADTVVFVLTPESVVSQYCEWEVARTLERGKRLIPVAASPLGAARPPAILGERQRIHFYPEPSIKDSGFGDGIKRLAADLAVDPAWIREHTRLVALAERWHGPTRSGSDDALLMGKGIEIAEAWLAARPPNAPEPPEVVVEFIKESRAASDRRARLEFQRLEDMRLAQEAREQALKRAETEAKAREAAQVERDAQAKRVKQRTLMGIAVAIVLTVIAVGLFVWALGLRQDAEKANIIAAGRQQEAEVARQQAEVARGQAEEFRDQGLLLQSQFLARLSEEETGKGEVTRGLLLALEALPDKESDDESTRLRRYWGPAEVSLEAARRLLREKGILAGHTDRVSSVAVSTDGARIVTGSADNTARVWDAKTFDELETLRRHTNTVTSVAVSPDGARIVTGSDDNSARVWDAKTFAELGQLKGHAGTVNSVAVSPDGTRIVTGSGDNTARVWELLPSGQALVADAQRAAPRCLTKAERQRYHLSPTVPRWCETTQKWPYDAATIANDAAFTARVHIVANRYQNAIAGLEQTIARTPATATRLAPELANAHDGIAWTAFLDVALMDKPAETLLDVLAHANKAVSLAPENASIRDTRGQIYLALGRSDEALADLDKAISLKFTSLGTSYARGRAHELKGNRDAAIADYRQAIARSGGSDWDKHAQAEARKRLEALGLPR